MDLAVTRGFLRWALAVAVFIVAIVGPGARTAPAASEIESLRQEIERLRAEGEANRRKTEALERKLDRVETETREEREKLEAKIEEESSTGAARRALDRYAGQSRFLVTGYGFAEYGWNDNDNENAFSAGFTPIFLFRPSDRILFEAETEVEIEDGETEVELEYALAHVLLTDYLTFSAGKFLLPFGEFIERLHPPWINKLVSSPLPYQGPNRIVPFTDIGAQLRGGTRLGDAGLLDYTVYVANGPSFESGELGARLEGSAPDINTGKAVGGRIGFSPLPATGDLGRLRIGASTYNGEANGGDWYVTWGLDASYRYDVLELRGEYLKGTLDRPGRKDEREGWYLQASYGLPRVLPDPFSRIDAVVRYSGANRLGDDPLRKPRQVAFGAAYWFTPSVAFKLEYDRDLPSNADNNHQILTQVAIGF